MEGKECTRERNVRARHSSVLMVKWMSTSSAVGHLYQISLRYANFPLSNKPDVYPTLDLRPTAPYMLETTVY